MGAVHRSSINCCNNDYACHLQCFKAPHVSSKVFPSPIFAFLDKVKDGNLGGRTSCRPLRLQVLLATNVMTCRLHSFGQ